MTKMTYRKAHLVELLGKKGVLTVSDIAELYGISLPSVRRLCALLEKEKRAIRTHGGLRSIRATNASYNFEIIDAEYAKEKAAIAHYAVGLIKNQQSLFLESGTTLKQFAIALAEQLRTGKISDVLIFTNSMANFEILQPVSKVILVGGFYRSERRDFCGLLSEKLIQSLNFDICFIGADGINIDSGLMAYDDETARFDELLIRRSEKSILLTNSEKFTKNSLISYCAVRDVSQIITDSKLPDSIRESYAAIGVPVTAVGNI